MNDLEKVLSAVKEINKSITAVLKESTYGDCGDLSGLEIDQKDADQLFLRRELQGILDDYQRAKDNIDYLLSPIKCTGILHQNSDGRYELKEGCYYTCGSGIEFYYYDDCYESWSWAESTVEANRGYHIVGYPQVDLEGLRVRCR